MGGEQSKPAPKPTPQVIKRKKAEEQKVDKIIKAEKISANLDQHVQSFKDKQAKYQAKIQVLMEKARQCISNGKQKDAKKYATEAAKLKKQLENIQTRRKVIDMKKDQLEIHQMNADVIDIMDQANQFTKQDMTGRLQEHIIATKQNKILQDQMNQQMKGMVQNSQEEEEVDDLMEELRGEVIKDKKKQIQAKNVGVQAETNKNKNVNTQKHKNDIDAMLDNLA